MSDPDFLIVGSGAAGAVVAKQLAEAGFSVVIFEQGPHLTEKDFTHDELQFVHRFYLTNNHTRQPNTYRRNTNETAKVQPAVGYGMQVGGGTVHFTGNYWRFTENDFREKSRWGAVAGSSLEDWPITYAELEPYYAKAERELGISGLAGSNPFEAPRSGPYPLPPMPVKSSGVLFERGAKKLGLHPFPAPVAILSKPYKGRQACTHCGLCERFGCEVRAKSSTLAAMIPAALKTGRCQLRTRCYVRKIETNKAGRATGVIYFDARGKEHRQRAKAVVVCANGAETPRLLLLSKSAQFPDGLANSSGQVGRNLMVDNGAAAMGLFPEQLNEFKGIQVTRALWDYYDSDPNKRGFWGGGGLDARFDFYPISFALEGLPKDVPRYGNGFRSFLANAFTRSMMVLSHSTALPYEKHGFDLDPTVKDAWGLPALRMTYDSPPDDLATMRWLLERQVEILEAAGATKVWRFPVDPVAFTVHIMGTARMGNDKRRSVVNRDNQTHDVPNLFLVDGSSLVTSGRQQPTATIQALAFRAADKMAAHAKAGNLGH